MCKKTIEQNVKILDKLESLTVGIAILQEQGKSNTQEHLDLKDAIEKQDVRISSNTKYINKALGIVGAITIIGWVGVKSLFTS